MALHINAREQSVGNLLVRRVLPYPKRRSVGPFVFLDHMGPLETENLLFVAEHPHIGLATATYLFEGEILHKDSIGSEQVIREHELNLMTAGKWITHLEQGLTEEIHGLQFWLALPKTHETCEPNFKHYEKEELPSWPIAKDIVGQVLMGTYEEFQAKTEFPARSLFAVLDSTSSNPFLTAVPLREKETGIYICEGAIETEEHGVLRQGELLVFDRESDRQVNQVLPITLLPGSRIAIFGGDPLDAKRFIKWNYVASDEALIKAAERKWEATQREAQSSRDSQN